MTLEEFITELRQSDDYIVHIYTRGSCYRFHLMLSRLFKGCVPYISAHRNHVITRHRGRYWDVLGEVENLDGYVPLKEEDLPMVESWSFYRNNLIRLNECPHCEEPLVWKMD